MLLIGLAIRLDSRGRALFRQPRVGQNGVPFVCNKFRSLKQDTAEKPSHLLVQFELTRVGRVLRATKLDELPQLWTEASGEMSFVGPRPSLLTQADVIRHRQRLGVLAIKPGITGMSQVLGVDMSEPRLLARLDSLYLRKRSVGLDARILLVTVARHAKLAEWLGLPRYRPAGEKLELAMHRGLKRPSGQANPSR